LICSAQHHPSSNSISRGEGRSIFILRPDDPQAVYFTPENFGISADGHTDVSAALQKAINQLKNRNNFGILFIPEGTYRISTTIYIPRAIRLIGYGQHRPVIVLGENAPGFREADPADKGQGRYMFWFVSNLSAPGRPVSDAGASTFYSAVSNINFRIDKGNPAAVALRTHFAQHSFISHVDIHIGSGKAGLYDVGNEMEDVRMFGGDYGIYTTKPSPGWQFMMVDTWFEGQRKAAIRTREAGLTIVRMHVRQVPTVIDIDSNYHEKLFMEDCQWDRVTGPAILISNRDNAMNQVSLRHVDCRDVPVMVRYRLDGQSVNGLGPMYRINRFTDGLQMDDPQADPAYKTIRELEPLTSMPVPPRKDIPDFPAMDTWVNLKTLGAKGDGETDDTRAIQTAIDKYPVIYIPQGWYRVSQTIRLKPNTVLIGLSPIATQFQVADNTGAFGGFGSPHPLLETPAGGVNIVSGIGLSTGARNPRAVACKWMSGGGSYMNDVKFIGGHGGMARPSQTSGPSAQTSASTAPGPAAAAPRPAIKEPGSDEWDSQYWSLWITNGGGGTFKDIWTANTYAAAGTYISNTATPGRIYAMSVEHHVRNEIRFNKASNWKVYALQLEEESRESSECQPLELEDCANMVFANLYMFRVIRVVKPYPYSIRQWGGRNIELLNVHNYSQTKYTTTLPLYDINTQTEIRPWEFARLFIPGTSGTGLLAPSATPLQLATGFEFAQSPCSDSKGNIYFCESRMRRIYRWSARTHLVSLLADYPWEPLSLSCDTKDNLLVVFKYIPQPGYLVNGQPEQFPNPPDAAGTSFSGWGNSGFGTLVYSIDPNAPDTTIRLLPKTAMPVARKISKALYPAHRWRDFHDFNSISVSRPKECFLAPDGVTIIPVEYDLARSTALAEAYPGKPLYTSDEYDKRTVKMQVSPEGYLSGLHYFAERGEFSSATDQRGGVYIADGQVYLYDSTGRPAGMIKVPERPTGIAFGGTDHTTLFITGHHSLYRVSIPGNGSAAANLARPLSPATATAIATSPATATPTPLAPATSLAPAPSPAYSPTPTPSPAPAPAPAPPPATATAPRFHVLALYENGGHHIGYSRRAKVWLDRLAADSNFAVDYIQNTDSIDEPFLHRYQLFIQLDYPPYAWKDKAVDAFRHYIEEGRGGWIGFHHATLLGTFDGYPLWEWFSQFMGGITYKNYIATFVQGEVNVEDRRHPVMKGVPDSFLIKKEEWYTYDKSPRPHVHVLASVDEASYSPHTDITMGDHPVVWTNEHVRARNVYIFMGHSPVLFDEPAYTKIFTNAIFWAAATR
jgi:type 1 glutamine amidotransferase